MSNKPLDFAADRMLGRLAKWLRILGYDVIYGRHLSGHGLIRAARADGRLILTRDRSLTRKQPPAFLFIDSNDYVEQLRQVMGACNLNPGAAFLAVVWCATPSCNRDPRNRWKNWCRPTSSPPRSASLGAAAVSGCTGRPRITRKCSTRWGKLLSNELEFAKIVC